MRRLAIRLYPQALKGSPPLEQICMSYPGSLDLCKPALPKQSLASHTVARLNLQKLQVDIDQTRCVMDLEGWFLSGMVAPAAGHS